MFKNKDAEKMADSDKVETVIGAGSIVKGELYSRGGLRIDGNVEGKISADGSVIIGTKGVVKANISASHIVVGGAVHGNLVAREKIEILSSGRVFGDVTTPASKFVVAEGVVFEGRCTMSQTDSSKQRVTKMPRNSEEDQEVGAVSKTGAA
jgi:cytoskeletal protein CcmA (bactofilin family)